MDAYLVKKTILARYFVLCQNCHEHFQVIKRFNKAVNSYYDINVFASQSLFNRALELSFVLKLLKKLVLVNASCYIRTADKKTRVGCNFPTLRFIALG